MAKKTCTFKKSTCASTSASASETDETDKTGTAK